MTREEAIERIKARFDKWALDDEDMKAIQTLVPELRESEDERIIRAIIDALYSHTNSINLLSSRGYQMGDIEAWLEKQKECLADNNKTSTDEDERIRKEINILYSDIDACITELLKARTDKDSESEGKALFKMEGLMVATLQDLSCIEDYLEKQKEPENTSASTMAPSCWQKEQKPIKWTDLTWKDIVELEGIINNVHYDFSAGIGQESFGKEVLERFRSTKGIEYLDEAEQKCWRIVLPQPHYAFEEEQKEQKSDWSDEDKEALDMCLDAIPKRWKTKSGVLLTKWLKDNIHLQPKQEWSEEDERIILDSIIDDYEKAAKSFCGYAGKIWLLKAIRDGEITFQSPQKLDASKLENFDPVDVLNRIKTEWPMAWEKVVGKQEWSEEDSKRYISIGATLATSRVLSREDYDADMSWLRDLVNIVKYSRPSWKPSKEQMEALRKLMKYAVSLSSYYNIQKEIESLYNDLNKLK